MATMGTRMIGPAALLLKGLITEAGTGNFPANASITDTDTSIPCVDSSIYPNNGVIELENEKIYYEYNDKATNTLEQCIRGFYGTTAAAHSAGTAGMDMPLFASGLGETHGGVTLTPTENTVEAHTDQAGVVPKDEIRTGTVIKVATSLAEVTLANLAMVHKESVTGSPGSQGIAISVGIGKSLLDSAKPLIIVPYIDGLPSNDIEDLMGMPKAGMKATGTMNFDNANQRIIGVEFTSYPDAYNNVFYIGAEVPTYIA